MGEIPVELARYRIERKLGRGGMGAVYLTHGKQLDRKVALKVLFFDGEGSVDRLHREARVIATVQHPHLCPVYDVGQFEKWHYLTMAYIDGSPLSNRIKKCGPMSLSDATFMLKAVALAVQ